MSTPSTGAQAAPAVAASTMLLGDTREWEAEPDLDLDDRDVDALAEVLGGATGAATAAAAQAAHRANQTQTHSFVKESAELERLLQALPYEEGAAARICEILDEYQEQCELLDPHLPHAVTRLMNFVHGVIRPGKQNPVPPITSTTGAILLDAVSSSSSYDSGAATRCPDPELLTRVFKVLYTLSKVRGYKTIVHFFPHEVADLEPTLALLQQQSMDEYETWETRYGLLLWLSIIVLIPFDLTTVDSSMTQDAHGAPAAATSTTAAPARVGIISSLISLGSRYLSDTGPPREAAAVMLAKLFSRADMHASHLGAFFRWCTSEVAVVSKEADAKRTSAKSVFLVTGVFKALTEIFRFAPREVLLKHVALVFEPLLRDHDRWARSTNTLLRKLFVKLAQRVSLTFLPARVAKWRYQRGHRSLLTTLQQASGSSAAKVHNPMLGSSHSSAPPPAQEEEPEDADEDDVPSEIEEIVQILLDGLRDRDTVVRWSSAKGIGRLTSCLPASFGDDVVEAVLELFSGRETDGAWHGGCLALAELARRGLLLPARLAQVVPITLRALTYDQRTATHSIGAHVRDAACFVMWAFARAYAPEVMTPYMQSLASGLLTLCVFDREVNVRRAASAAFQEHVGRQGSMAFKHGMAILQVADYFTVSNRVNAYTLVAIEVARYEEYTLALAEHLLALKVKHWEKDLRELAGRTLGLLAKRNGLAQAFVRDVVVRSLLDTAAKSTDLVEKHGAVYALAEVLKALHELDPVDYVDQDLRVQVCGLVTTLTSSANSQLLNGRGGQIMREALCHLISAIGSVRLLTTNATTLALMRPFQLVLDDNLTHTNLEVQTAAIAAIEQYVRAYYLPIATDSPQATTEKLARAKPVMDHYTRTLGHPSSLAGATRGFAAALGTFPRALLVTTVVKATDAYSAVASNTTIAPPPSTAVVYQPLSRILSTLITASTECGQTDAETRRNAVQAIVRLVGTLTDEDITQWMTPMPPAPVAASPAAASSAASSSSSSSGPISAAREKELKAAQKAAAVQQKLVTKYWHRDLRELGVPGERICDRVATCLLVGLDDYATDNRGDVGSWVREACMFGLETLLLKLARIHATTPSIGAFTPHLSSRVFPPLLKQAVEKIDRVREKSGQIFHRLLWAQEPEIPFVPLKKELRDMFPLTSATGKVDPVDWSSPSQTFPLLMPLMALPLVETPTTEAEAASSTATTTYPYHRALLSGLVISVGGLTESVVKSSSEAFLSYVSDHSSRVSSCENAEEAAESLAMLQHLAKDLLHILTLEKGHARVIVPAFKTLELLLGQNLLEPLTLDVCSFGSDLQNRVWREVSKSTNMHKLMASISVLVGLLSYPPPLRSETFQCLLTLLGHATYPKIRRLTGESLYNALLISEELVPGAEEDPDHPDRVAKILDILTLTPWDGPLPQARRERDQLYGLLQLTKPIVKTKKATTTSSAGALGDISALGTDYSTLVRNIGY